MYKRYCKLIFTTLVIALVFSLASFSASAQFVPFADPISAAWAGAAVSSGISMTGISGMEAQDVSTIVGTNYTDPVGWDTIKHSSHVKITDVDSDPDSVDVTLSSELATAGYDRLGLVNTRYNLSPGSVHSFGSVLYAGGYSFPYYRNGTYYGNSLGPFSDNFHYSIPGIGSTYSQAGTSQYFYCYSDIGSSSTFRQYYYSQGMTQDVVLFLAYYPSNPSLSFGVMPNFMAFQNTYSQSPVTVQSRNPTLTFSQSGVVHEPDDEENILRLPKSYVNDISYVSGESITSESGILAVLEAVMESYANDDIESSVYVPNPGPTPPPPSSDTIADTEYSVLDLTLQEFKEFFGDIYSDLHDFKESFGDYVEDVASGWTEVFGDISSDLHDFKESFGDWVDDIASGWTEIFGDIYSTLSSISSTISGTISNTLSAIETAVETLVDTIENADFQFIEGFWKNFITPFNTLFNTIKSHLSIWHYVVEWLSSISGVFTFYLGVMNGAGSGFLLPIYACFAGTVVLAVYKRFGK